MAKLTADRIVERALEIGDTEGLDAVTIRRLATDLGVTPMALYWHFKNKERLLVGMADHLIAGFAVKPADDRPWQARLRDLVQGLIRTLRAHPCAKSILEQVGQTEVPNFLAIWDEALGLTRSAGFTDEESVLIARYLLHSAVSIADAPIHFDACHSPEEVDEIVRVKRLGLEALPADRYPNLVAMAGPLVRVPPELYDTFGVGLVLAGIEALAARRSAAGGAGQGGEGGTGQRDREQHGVRPLETGHELVERDR
ncbi:MAG TPA: TetR family transcriptional regulator [Nonomuraea sp.]|nr:TetR family transcriptional regulator [Nonomuraea sp.]